MSKENNSKSNEKKTTTKKKTTNNKNTTKKDKVEKIVKEKKVTNTKNTKSKDTKNNKPKKVEKNIIEEKNINEDIISEEIEYDEDLDFDNDYEEDYEEIISPKEKNKPKKESKKESKEEKVSKENIKKIEKKAKEKSKAKKKQQGKLNEIGILLEKNINVIIGFVVGVLITVLIAIIIWPDRIATLKDGTQSIVKVGNKNYTANDLYEQMKESYNVSKLLDAIDNDILTEMYPEDDKMNEEVKSNAEYYINMYQQYYNYTEEEFLSANGFSSYDDFLDHLRLENRRKKYEDDYVEKNLTDKEIQKYYDENVYGDINCQHILVEAASDSDSSDENSDKLSDEDAKKLAEEIIDKINDGKSWEDIQKEYKDKITFEDLGYQSWDSDLEDSFKEALKEMDDKSYSKEPVKTSYGYHVIYRIDQKKAPSLKSTKSKIIDNLVSDKENDDENLQYKALISLREEKKIKFNDTNMKEKYEAYKKQYK